MENVPRWAALTTWAVVNLVNLLQSVGFASRRRHGMVVNHLLGVVVAVLAVPATVALVGYARVGSLWWLGPVMFDLFVLLMLTVDYVWPVEFRHPAKPAILVPYPRAAADSRRSRGPKIAPPGGRFALSWHGVA